MLSTLPMHDCFLPLAGEVPSVGCGEAVPGIPTFYNSKYKNLSCFEFPLLHDVRNNHKLLQTYGISTGDGRHPQCDVSGDLHFPKKCSPEFYKFAAALPYAVCVRFNGLVLSIHELVSRFGYDWVYPKFKAVFVLGYASPVSDSPSFLVPPSSRIENCPIFVYMHVSMPALSPSGLLFDEVPPFQGGMEFSDLGVRYFIKLVATCSGHAFVDRGIAYQVYTRLYADFWRKPDFHSVAYYSSVSYPMWSLKNHQDQWRTVLGSLLPSSVLVAPGDGVGVISSMWPGTSVCGDVSRTSVTSPNVNVETISSTLARSVDHEGVVFVLSYVTDFLSPGDWKFLSDSRSPVFIMDFKHVLRSGMGPVHIEGPGLVSYRSSSRSASFITESRAVDARVLYSENLLGLGPKRVVALSEPVEWLFSVSPKDQYYTSDPTILQYAGEVGVNMTLFTGQPSTLVLNRVEECVDFLHLSPYFAPIGRTVDVVPEIDPTKVQHLLSRTLYKAADSPLFRSILRGVPSAVVGKHIYFFVIQEIFDLRYQFTSSTSNGQGVIRFTSRPVLKTGVELKGSILTIHTVSDVYTLPLPLELAMLSTVLPYSSLSPAVWESLVPFFSGVDKLRWNGGFPTSHNWVSFSSEKFRLAEHLFSHVREHGPMTEKLLVSHCKSGGRAFSSSEIHLALSSDRRFAQRGKKWLIKPV